MKQAVFALFAIAIATSSLCQCTPSSVNSPTSLSDDASIGTLVWPNLANILSSDDSRSTVIALSLFNTQTTHYIMAKNFGFAIPGNAVICGVVAEVEKSFSGVFFGCSIRDNTVRLLLSGTPVGTNLKSADDWSSTEGYTSYGSSSSNPWSLSLTPADVNNTDFGIAIAADVVSGLGFPAANVNHIRMTVYYNIILPVTWLNFSAAIIRDNVRLNWKTAAEVNNKFFIIERSENGYRWIAQDTIQSKFTGADYEWYDRQPASLNYYRLRQVDLDGNSSFSKTINIKYNKPALKDIRIINSSQGTYTVLSPDRILLVRLFDLQGRMQSFSCLSRNETSQVIGTSQLIPGIYIMQVVTKQGTHTSKLYMGR